jgi:hypothetical protein
VLLKLAPGSYRALARLIAGGAERGTSFRVPQTGQRRAVIVFPEG